MEWIFIWFLLFFIALCIGFHFLAKGYKWHGKHSDEESEEYKGHTHAVSSDGTPAKKGHSCCH
jgi:hypothetical protein